MHRIVCTLLLAGLPATAGAPKVVPEATVVLVVKGEGAGGALPGVDWANVKATVSKIFDRIGIHFAWVYERRRPPCGDDCIVIRVRFAARGTGDPETSCPSVGAFGCSRPFRTHSTPDVVVMYEEIHECAGTRAPLYRSLLAHVMAHEIAHVIEVLDAHSEIGIMKQQWSTADLNRMAISTLEFTSRDVELMQRGVEFRRNSR